MSKKDTFKSWLVLAAVTFSVFIETGILKGLSVLLPVLIEQFETQTWIIGSSIAIVTLFGYIIGLSADILVKTLTPRICVMLSGLLGTVGLIICSQANDPSILLYGLCLLGFLLLQENILMGIIPSYFDRYFTTAVGVYACGTGLGITLIPILTQFLLEAYGWRGTVLLLGAVSFNSSICGALLTPIQNVNEHQPLIKKKKPSRIHRLNDLTCLIQKEMVQTFKAGRYLLTDMCYVTYVLIPDFILGYVLVGWIIYIVHLAVSRGASITEASIVSSSGGIGIFLMRALLPLVLHLVTNKQLFNISAVCITISLSLMSVLQHYVTLSVVSFVYGLAIGANGGSVYIAAKEYSGDNHYHAISFMHFGYGVASIFSGYVTGQLFDLTGSFLLSFNILAGVSSLTMLTVCFGDNVASKS